MKKNEIIEISIIYDGKEFAWSKVVGYIKLFKNKKKKVDIFYKCFNKSQDVNDFKESLEIFQRENPNMQINFFSRKEFRKNKTLSSYNEKNLKDYWMAASLGNLLTLFQHLLYIRCLAAPLLIIASNAVAILLNNIIIERTVDILTLRYSKKIANSVKKFKIPMFLLYAVALLNIYNTSKTHYIDATATNEYLYEDDDEFVGLDTEEKVDILYETLESNPNLEEDEYNYTKNLESYFLENPYLDYKELNDKFSKLKIIRGSENFNNLLLEDNVAGITSRGSSRIRLRDEELYQDVLFHEIVHLTGSLPYSFLNEGTTELITSEFYGEKQAIKTVSYYKAVTFVRLLCEIIGPDAVIQSYSEESMGAINDGLRSILPDDKYLVKFYKELKRTTDNFSRVRRKEYTIEDYLEGKGSESEYYKSLLETLDPYVQEKFGYSLFDTNYDSGIIGKCVAELLFREDVITIKGYETYEKCLRK